jgi:hypothetical protein
MEMSDLRADVGVVMDDNMTAALGAVCDPDMSRNPVAWHRLHKAGLTVELLKEVSEGDTWLGPKPFFQNAPDQNGAMWKYLESRND